MREIITLQVGQCGNRMGQNFWELISEEHNISHDGTHQGQCDFKTEKLDVYYDESFKSRHIPRAIFMDLEPGPIDSVQGSSLGRIFRPENFINGKNGSSNLWAKGYYTEGPEIINLVMDSLRKEAERADRLQGFQISHAIGGGTGSGLTCLLIQKLGEEFPGQLVQTFSVFPSEVCATVLEPYNAVPFFGFAHDDERSVHVLDNDALENLCVRSLKCATTPTYQDLNHLIASAMSGMTCSFRFPGQLNASLRKYVTNMIPYRMMNFLMCSYAPLAFQAVGESKAPTVENLFKEVFSSRNLLCNANLRDGRFVTGAVSLRGIMSTSEVEERLAEAKKGQLANSVDWVPNSLMTSVCNVSRGRGVERDATFIVNSSAIQTTLKRINQQFSSLFRRKAFLHWYLSEGMDEMEFSEHESRIGDILSEYELPSNENPVMDDEDYGDSEDYEDEGSEDYEDAGSEST